MSRRTKYTVAYHADGAAHVARFSHLKSAHIFARGLVNAEIVSPEGLVGQYLNGATTTEFQPHHDAVFANCH